MYTNYDSMSSIIFVNTKKTADYLQNLLNKKGHKAQIIHGGIDTTQRDKIIDDFRMNVFQTLISTNVLARGIDVPEVDLVVNFDTPFYSNFGFKEPDYANYLHRVGRTGRFGTKGCAFTMTCDEIEDEIVKKIGSHYEIEITQVSNLDFLKAFSDNKGLEAV